MVALLALLLVDDSEGSRGGATISANGSGITLRHQGQEERFEGADFPLPLDSGPREKKRFSLTFYFLDKLILLCKLE